MTYCKFVDSSVHAQTRDPWCETHERSAILCLKNEIAEHNELYTQFLQLRSYCAIVGSPAAALGAWCGPALDIADSIRRIYERAEKAERELVNACMELRHLASSPREIAQEIDDMFLDIRTSKSGSVYCRVCQGSGSEWAALPAYTTGHGQLRAFFPIGFSEQRRIPCRACKGRGEV